MAAQNQILARLIVNGRDCGLWESKSGGGVTYDNQKRRPAGQRAQRVSRGLGEYDDIELTQAYDPADHAELEKWLHDQGAAAAQVVVRDYDDDLIPMKGAVNTKTYDGRLGAISPADGDANSNDFGEWSVTVTVGRRS